MGEELSDLADPADEEQLPQNQSAVVSVWLLTVLKYPVVFKLLLLLMPSRDSGIPGQRLSTDLHPFKAVFGLQSENNVCWIPEYLFIPHFQVRGKVSCSAFKQKLPDFSAQAHYSSKLHSSSLSIHYTFSQYINFLQNQRSIPFLLYPYHSINTKERQ